MARESPLDPVARELTILAVQYHRIAQSYRALAEEIWILCEAEGTVRTSTGDDPADEKQNRDGRVSGLSHLREVLKNARADTVE